MRSIPLRVLFLDFDGVLTKVSDDVQPTLAFEWLPILVSTLEPWSDVCVAVHSTWRYDHTDAELLDLLGPLGARFIGSVPRGPRGEAIRWFLYSNPSIRSYLVLDDARDEFSNEFAGSLVVCDSRLGISDVRARAAVVSWLVQSSSEGPEFRERT